MTQYVAYFRVSTTGQGESGLGLEAQQEAVRRFAGTRGEVLASYTEVESGGRNDRPQLLEALEACRRRKATLLIAKLDRLSRNVAFIATLMESKIQFVACDLEGADPMRLHIEAVFAEEERRRISQRTKVALAAAKARGVQIGGFRGYIPDGKKQKDRAAKFKEELRPHIEAAQASGVTTLRGIANALNEKRLAAPRGGVWSVAQVRRLINR